MTSPNPGTLVRMRNGDGLIDWGLIVGRLSSGELRHNGGLNQPTLVMMCSQSSFAEVKNFDLYQFIEVIQRIQGISRYLIKGRYIAIAIYPSIGIV